MADEAEKKKKSVHEKHKQRLREKFLTDGDFSSFYDHEILEMLLSYSVVRKNTNIMAHDLIDKFKTFNGVFEASPEALMEVDGVGERTATLIKMQYEILRTYLTSKHEIKNKPYSSAEVIPYLKGLFFGKKQELLYMVTVDSKDKVIRPKLICTGINDLAVDYRTIEQEAINVNAYGVILAHNHPNGILVASQNDIDTTRMIEDHLKRVKIRLIDHFVFANNDYVSILNEHCFRPKYFK